MRDDGGEGEEDATERTLLRRPPAMGPGGPPPLELGFYLAVPAAEATRRVPVGAAGLLLGRHAACDVVLEEHEVSRRHCRIDLDKQGVVLTDLGSSNGTFLRGRRLARPARLAAGETFTVAGLTLRLERRDRRDVAREATQDGEIRQAVEYVRAILPQPIGEGPVQAEWWFAPSSRLGGDAFGYQFLSDALFAGFVLDVSGHGIGAALHAANVANTIRRRALPGVDFADPAQVAAGLNAVFPMEEHNGLMFTLWYFVYHLGERRLRFCAAGHHPSFLAAPGAEPLPLWLKAPALGMLPRGAWPAGRAEVAPGSRLYLFSDGAFEIVAATGEAWVIEDLRRIMTAGDSGPGSEAERIYRAVRAAARGAVLEDDFSVLVFRF